jgi:two-component system, response regulator
MIDSINILLVEDDRVDRELEIRALTKNNPANHIEVVKDGNEAIEFIFCTGTYTRRKMNPLPHLIIMDLKLPKVNGLEVLQMIRSDPRTKAIPVVMLTSSREGKDVIESYHLGVNSYVVKPLDFNKFSEAVSNLGSYWCLINQSPKG